MGPRAHHATHRSPARRQFPKDPFVRFQDRPANLRRAMLVIAPNDNRTPFKPSATANRLRRKIVRLVLPPPPRRVCRIGSLVFLNESNPGLWCFGIGRPARRARFPRLRVSLVPAPADAGKLIRSPNVRPLFLRISRSRQAKSIRKNAPKRPPRLPRTDEAPWPEAPLENGPIRRLQANSTACPNRRETKLIPNPNVRFPIPQPASALQRTMLRTAQRDRPPKYPKPPQTAQRGQTDNSPKDTRGNRSRTDSNPGSAAPV